MWIVAVGTADAVVVHLALQEGAVDVDFVLDLSVGEIQTFVKQGRPVGIQQRVALIRPFRAAAASRG